jgi:hypothetical protein
MATAPYGTMLLLAVIVVACSSVVAVILLPTSTGSSGSHEPVPPAGCSQASTSPSPPLNLTPENPVLLLEGATYPTGQGNLFFCIDAPVELLGSWVASAPLALAVFSLPFGLTTWPAPGDFVSHGSLNVTLFPGTFAIVFVSGQGGGAAPVLTATQSIHADFDLVLTALQEPEVTGLPASGYLAWPLSTPLGESTAWLNGSIFTTSCSFEMAILPGAVFQAFQTNQSAIHSSSALEILGVVSTCSASPVSQNSGLGTAGPFSVAPGDMLVFLNAGQSVARVTFLSPLLWAFFLAP